MSTGQLEFRHVLEMIELIKASSNFSEIRLRSGELEVELRRGGAPAAVAEALSDAAVAAAAQVSATAPRSEPRRLAVREGVQGGQGEQVVKAPMVGTIYHAAQPGAAPFVQVGQRVGPTDQICIIEVMKLMNSIPAGCTGVVTDILVADGQAVEHGQELFVIAVR